ncbi:hypothetical protein [Gluconobacter cerinus]|uniref:hypothetical protein n=1 Tax=Gluconobacter cerinus TaxID=38307 RepID=UPI001B8C22D2|nr:hypothetical protein [Gluconobacter cerinus]MBS0995832.1 hypothetical protein [Gluconobacter cerinus]
MAFKFNASTLTSVLALATPYVTGLVANKGAAYQKIANQAVRSAVTASDNGVDKLVSSFTKFEAENPLVQTAVTEFTTLAKAAGFNVPTIDAVQSHIKSAIYDLATALVPADQLTDMTAVPAPAAAS